MAYLFGARLFTRVIHRLRRVCVVRKGELGLRRLEEVLQLPLLGPALLVLWGEPLLARLGLAVEGVLGERVEVVVLRRGILDRGVEGVRPPLGSLVGLRLDLARANDLEIAKEGVSTLFEVHALVDKVVIGEKKDMSAIQPSSSRRFLCRL